MDLASLMVSSVLAQRVVNYVASGAKHREVYGKAVLKIMYFLDNAKLKEVGVKIYEIGDNKIASLVRVTYSCSMPVPYEMQKRTIKRTLTPGSFLPSLLLSFTSGIDNSNESYSKGICDGLLANDEFQAGYEQFKMHMDEAVKSYLQDPDQIEIIQSKIKKFKGRIRDRQANELKTLLRKLSKSAWDKDDVLSSWLEVQCEEVMES